MELLKIDERHDAFYRKGNGEWAAIRDIEKDDLLELIRAVASNEEIELAECTTDSDIRNPIEKTIYQQVYKVLVDLNDKREVYQKEIDAEFSELERKYELE